MTHHSSRLDPLLEPFMTTLSDKQAQTIFQELLYCSLDIVIIQELRKCNVAADELEDFKQDARIRLWEELDKHRRSNTRTLYNIQAYTRILTRRITIDSSRSKSPGRRRVAQAIYVVLNEQKTFVQWEFGNEKYCGPRAMLGSVPALSPEYIALSEQNDQGFIQDELHNEQPSDVAGQKFEKLNELIAHLFHWVGGPLTVKELIYHISLILAGPHETTVSITEREEEKGQELQDTQAKPEEQVLQDFSYKEIGRFIRLHILTTNEACSLLIRFHRDFILHNLGLSPLELAESMGYNVKFETSLLRFRDLIWIKMPVTSDAQIAGILDIQNPDEKASQQKVSNLRMTATRKVTNWASRQWDEK